jgi:hypothetical protein
MGIREIGKQELGRKEMGESESGMRETWNTRKTENNLLLFHFVEKYIIEAY